MHRTVLSRLRLPSWLRRRHPQTTEQSSVQPISVGLALVVIVYDDEIEMCVLLARSLALYLSPADFDSVVVIGNSVDDARLKSEVMSRILPELGPWGTRFRYVSGAEAGAPIGTAGEGYAAQQALKLEVARVLDISHYLILDAKNHLVTPLGRESLFAADGRPLSEFGPGPIYLAPRRRASFAFWGATIGDDDASLPTVTPYLMVTSIVRDMLDELERKTDGSVLDLVRSESKPTEFFLYAGYVETHGGMRNVYAAGSRQYVTLFASWPQDPAVVTSLLNTARSGVVYAMGVHRKRFPQLSVSQIEDLASLWVGAKLFASQGEAEEFIAEQARKHA